MKIAYQCVVCRENQVIAGLILSFIPSPINKGVQRVANKLPHGISHSGKTDVRS
jgi:hypothetical protein